MSFVLFVLLRVNDFSGSGDGSLELQGREVGRHTPEVPTQAVGNGETEESEHEQLGLSAFYPIYACRTGKKVGWQVKLDCETSLISCEFPTPPLPSSFPSGILAG